MIDTNIPIVSVVTVIKTLMECPGYANTPMIYSDRALEICRGAPGDRNLLSFWNHSGKKDIQVAKYFRDIQTLSVTIHYADIMSSMDWIFVEDELTRLCIQKDIINYCIAYNTGRFRDYTIKVEELCQAQFKDVASLHYLFPMNPASGTLAWVDGLSVYVIGDKNKNASQTLRFSKEDFLRMVAEPKRAVQPLINVDVLW